MTEELIQTLQIIKDRYGIRSSGSVFIPLRDFPWYAERNHQLEKLCDEGMIAEPRFFDNGAEITLTKEGHGFLEGLLFPSVGSSMTCPVCGFHASVINTDASRSWAEISCENCSTYSIKKNALLYIPFSDLPFLAGYYRHVRHQPLTMQCDSQETVKCHIEETRLRVNRDYQMRSLLSHYYQQMKSFEDEVVLDHYPAVAYAQDKDDLLDLLTESARKGFVSLKEKTITVTRKGKEWMDEAISEGLSVNKRNEVFISHRTTDGEVGDMINDFLVGVGVPKERVFCSSLPGNDVGEKISPEVKAHLKKASIIVLILSKDYYESAYCLNEAGVAWYLDDVKVIPIALPEIDHTKMRGFIDSDYKLRRLNEESDLSYLVDRAHEQLGIKHVEYSVITRAQAKLKHRYESFITNRDSSLPQADSTIPEDAEILLVYAASGNGEITRIKTLSSPDHISVNGKVFSPAGSPREAIRWIEALEKLISHNLIRKTDSKGEFYKLTSDGYEQAKKIQAIYKIETENDPLKEIKELEEKKRSFASN